MLSIIDKEKLLRYQIVDAICGTCFMSCSKDTIDRYVDAGYLQMNGTDLEIVANRPLLMTFELNILQNIYIDLNLDELVAEEIIG